jgi:hypothetical protein
MKHVSRRDRVERTNLALEISRRMRDARMTWTAAEEALGMNDRELASLLSHRFRVTPVEDLLALIDRLPAS